MIRTQKKSDLVDDLFKSGVGFEAMPLHDVVIPYAEADVRACGEIYLDQINDYAKPSNQSLVPIRDLSNEMLLALTQIERNGINVDQEALSAVKHEFSVEQKQLTNRLYEICDEAMGDTPINLNSNADVSSLVYSRKVIDRHMHKQVFNIGIGPTGKPLRPPRMKKTEFAKAVRTTTEVVKKTVAICCDTCDGRGRIQKYKVNGDPYKNLTKCPSCGGVGAFYQSTGKTAGLKLTPKDPSYASVNGFKVDKETLSLLIDEAEAKGADLAVEFLTKYSRLNAVSVYLDSFVKGIETWTRSTSLLHTNFNQCVTSTGRLSSSNPNFQNQPKKGFPIRKCVVSRFQGGSITEADFSALEWRCAGELSRDQQIIADIENKKDIHSQTATIIHRCKPEEVSKDLRASVKRWTFSPLYGGIGAGTEPHIQAYFKAFFKIYTGLARYHKKLTDGVLLNGIVETPSGRQYYWPNAKRFGNGRISNQTQIVNFPVQGFGNDLVQLSVVRAHRKFIETQLQSLLILTVHDSIVVDTHPDEVEQVNEILTWAMSGVLEEASQRWGYNFALPLAIDIETGSSWLL
jgi:DNA polymerase I-like protein with 3'-5' exonuclease and polymerase domains